jgi:murein DD-endopeptidase MepM/ murein hydrolase activator NlpD
MIYTQYPIDGKPGKTYKVTSPFGWRTHPTSGNKSHHNGVDLWGGASTIYIESFRMGKVVFAGPSKSRKADGSLGGFGFHVMIKHIIDGEVYVSVYAHLVEGSIKVKVGDRVVAGTVLGKMGATGDVTGKHLHWEICKGKKYAWSATGKNFVDPMAFTKALIAKEAVVASAPKSTPETAKASVMPAHSLPVQPAAKPAAAAPIKIKEPVKTTTTPMV